MQDAQQPGPQVVEPAVGVDQLVRARRRGTAIALTVKSRRTRSSARVAGLTSGSAPGLRVGLGPRAGDVDRPRRRGRPSRSRSGRRRSASPPSASTSAPVLAVDDQVEVGGRPPEQRVADRAADQVRVGAGAPGGASRTAAKPGQGGDPLAEAVGAISRAARPRIGSGSRNGRFPTMTPLADARAPQDPGRLARPPAHLAIIAVRQPDRDRRRLRRLRWSQETSPTAAARRRARSRPGARSRPATPSRSRPSTGRSTATTWRAPATCRPSGSSRPTTPRSGASRPASCSSSRRSSPRGRSTSRTRTRCCTRSAPTRARSSGRRTSAASAPPRPPTRTASSTRSRCRRRPASTRARRSRCGPRTASCCGASRCPAAARPRRS